ncbi:restriction endonuclease subunit S [Microbacterium sp.]|uniref:restriction endonuclease subunit S n=1 Tax=Microbacterium sp. TaxID=51671 RepID=UPI0037C819B7
MSRIDELIRDLCPNGVEVKTLGEVGEFIRGNGLQKADLRDAGFPAVHYGQIHTHYGVWATKTKSFTDENIAVKLRHARPGDLLIATTSEDDDAVAKATAWLGDTDVAVSGDAYIYRHELEPKYVSYFFQSTSFQDQKRRFISGTKVRRVSGDSLAKIRIPVPPLEVQREIVRVLDQFTQLEAELEAELEARRRQYEHYQRALLAVGSSVENVPMGEIAAIGTGRTDRKDATVDGAFPLYVRSKDVLASDRWEFDETAIIIPGEGGIGEIFHFAAGKYALHQRAYRVAPHDTRILPRFLYFYLRESFGDYVRQRAVTATVTSLRRSMLTDFPVPLLPLEEQTRVVETLDQLDALINDIRVGLPAELAARRKQYEYYRDKLLTFTEAA